MPISKTFRIWVHLLFLLLLVPLAILFLVLPLLIARTLVSIIAKSFGGLRSGRMIGQLCGFHAVDEINSAPVANLLVSLYMEGQIDLDLLKARFFTNVLKKRLPSGKLQYPELYSYISEFMGFSFWRADQNFNTENHFTYFQSTEVIDEGRLQQIRDELIRRPWKPKMPLWEFIIIEKYQRNREVCFNNLEYAAGKQESGAEQPQYTPVVLLRAHHALLDGYSLINILVEDMANVDLVKVIAQPSLPVSKKKRREQKEIESVTFWRKLALPFRALYEFSMELNKEADRNPWNSPNMKFNKTGTFTFANPISIDYIKGIKNFHGVSFTAILLAGICGGIRNEMEAAHGHAQIPPFINCFTALPVKRHPKKLTNHLTYSVIQLPTGIGNPRERLLEIEDRIQKLKKSSLPILNFYLAQTLGSFPRIILKKFVGKNFPATVAVSNFPAPNEIWTVNGTNVYKIQFEAGPMLAMGIGYCCLSYNGNLGLFAGVDSAIPNSFNISKGLVHNFEQELLLLNSNTPRNI